MVEDGVPTGAAGRILRVDARLAGQAITFVNVYAPTNPVHRPGFFGSALAGALPPAGTPLLVGGDFNCVADLGQDTWYAPGATPPGSTSRITGTAALGDMQAAWQLADAWRRRHPLAAGPLAVTHWSASHNSGARLDRLLPSAALEALAPVTAASIGAGAPTPSDHKPVFMAFQAPRGQPIQGKGLAQFPITLLNFGGATEEALRDFVHRSLAPVMATTDADAALTHWLAAKAGIVDFARALHAKERAGVMAIIDRCQRAAAAAAAQLAADAGVPGVPPAVVLRSLSEAQAAQAAVIAAWHDHALGALLGADVLEHLYGDGSTKFFHDRGRPPPAPTVVTALHRPDRHPGDDTGNAVAADLSTRAGVAAAMRYAEVHFSSDSPCGLFREREVSVTAQDALLCASPPSYRGGGSPRGGP